MEALRFTDSIPRYAWGKVAGRLRRSAHWTGPASLRYDDISPPPLPSEEWVRVHTRYGGICGSDISLVRLQGSTAPSVFMSFPCTPGHENVGVVAEVGGRAGGANGPGTPVEPGQRVVVNPILSCVPRGFAAGCCPMCARGEPNLCQRFREGPLAPGMIVGGCRETGGSWGPSFVAHRSQVLPVPDGVSDESAVLAEPFAVALHAVLRNRPDPGDDVLILGAGVIGLLTLAALRALEYDARVIVAARHPFQREMAQRFGADVVLHSHGRRLYEDVAALTGGEVLRPVVGRPVVRGGPRVVYECVGKDATIDDALRLTGSGGTMVLVGLAGLPQRVDWTPVWMNEVRVHGAFCYADEEFRGERIDSLRLALRLMSEGLDLAPLLTHRFRLADYRRALDAVTSKRSSGVLRAAFEFDPDDAP